MKRKVIINRLPKAEHGGTFTNNRSAMPWPALTDQFSKPSVSVNKSLSAVPREMANLEAEKGEVAVLPSLGGIPEAYVIGGQRHAHGGTPLNLPSDSFIFSDTRSLKIKDKDILKQFGMSYKRGGYTPAEIAKKYDINSYRKVLADNDADKIQKNTAEQMISNYNIKLGQLALLQESMKGFPQGIPLMALPYIQSAGIDINELFESQESPEMEQSMEMEDQMSMYGGSIIDRLQQMKCGGLPKAQVGLSGTKPGLAFSNNFNFGNIGTNLSDPIAEPFIRQRLPENANPVGNELFKLEQTYGAGFQNEDIANALLTGIDFTTSLFNTAEAEQKKKKFKELTMADNAIGPMNQPIGQRGDYHFLSGMFRPDQSGYMENTGQNAKYGGSLEKYQRGRQVRRKNRRNQIEGNRVFLNRQTGLLEIYDANNRLIGYLNQPNYNQGQQIYNQQTTTPTKEKVVETKTVKTAKSKLPEGAIIVDDANVAYDVPDSDIRRGLVYEKQKDGSYKQVTLTYKHASMSGSENYESMYGRTLDQDIEAANQMLFDLEKQNTDKVKYVTHTEISPGKYKWTIHPDSANKLSLEQREFLTRVGTVGSGITKDSGKGEYLGATSSDGNKAFVIGLQKKNNKYNSYGFADPDFLEYQYWKVQRRNANKTAMEFSSLSPENKLQNRKDMLNFYGIDATKYTDTDLKNKEKLYGVDSKGYSIITGKEGATPKYYDPSDGKTYSEQGDKDHPRKLINGNEIGIVGANQAIFSEGTYRPAHGDDALLGMEHMDVLQPVIDYGDTISDVTETIETDKQDDLKAEHLKNLSHQFPDEWWLQDKVKTAQAARNLANLMKFYPWQATPAVTTPDMAYWDPTRALAASAEQARIAADTSAQFTGPQAYSARASQLQGTAAKNAADILANYMERNVGISNQQAAQNASILNQYSQNKALADTMLWDKYQTVNQEFETAKQQARNALTDQYANAITNRAYTANLNRMYPQYAIDPSSGGIMYFHDPRELEASAESQTFTDVYKKIYNENPSLQSQPEKVAEIAMKMLGMEISGSGSSKSKSKNPSEINPMAMMYAGFNNPLMQGY